MQILHKEIRYFHVMKEFIGKEINLRRKNVYQICLKDTIHVPLYTVCLNVFHERHKLIYKPLIYD